VDVERLGVAHVGGLPKARRARAGSRVGLPLRKGNGDAVPDRSRRRPLVQVSDVSYAAEVGGVHLAGLKELDPVSDHAPIVFSAFAS